MIKFCIMKQEKKVPKAAKDKLSQDDLQHDVKTFAETAKPHAALERPDGKNNGAEPAAFAGQQKWHT
jgi:hypothetical protein